MAGNKLTAGTNNLLAVIGDEETVVGMLLAGVGNVDGRKSSNFFVVDDASAWRRPRAPRPACGSRAVPGWSSGAVALSMWIVDSQPS